jgi:hypothetical protein
MRSLLGTLPIDAAREKSARERSHFVTCFERVTIASTAAPTLPILIPLHRSVSQSIDAQQSRRCMVVPMPAVGYRYELRRGEEVVTTGHLSLECSLEVGEQVEIGESRGIVRAIEPLLGQPELRLVVQLQRDSGLSAIRAWPAARPDRARRSRPG